MVGTSMLYDKNFHLTYIRTKSALLTGTTWNDGSGRRPIINAEAISNNGKQLYIKAFRSIGITIKILIQDLSQATPKTKVTIRATNIIFARLKKEEKDFLDEVLRNISKKLSAKNLKQPLPKKVEILMKKTKTKKS